MLPLDKDITMQKMRADYAKDPKPFRSQATKNPDPQPSFMSKLTKFSMTMFGIVWLFVGMYLLIVEFFNQFP